MEHFFFFDGNSEEIDWIIKTNNSTITQKRKHPEIYLNKVNAEQSKYIAMHVGLFWGIGRFIIKNEDKIIIKIDEKEMFEYFFKNGKSSDKLISARIHFITQLIEQRRLKINYELISKGENLASISL